MPTLEPSADLLPYVVNAPLWTDGTIKQRSLAVPPGSTIDVTDDGTWTFPSGSVLPKNFLLESVRGDTATRHPVETRLMIRSASGWDFLKYRWNSAGTDAIPLEGQAIFSTEVELEDGRKQPIDYLFPNHAACTACHSASAELTLGTRTEQINRPIPHRSGANQLDALAALGPMQMG